MESFIEERSFSDVLDGLLSSQPAPPRDVVLAAGVAALIVVLFSGTWRPLRGVVTIVHEAGHAIVALLTGRRLEGIRLHSDTSGVTFWRGRASGLGAVAALASGYLAPAGVGLGAAALLGAGRITALLWSTILLLAAMLIAIRNLYGVASILLTGGVVFTVSWYGTDPVQAAFGYAFCWFLLLGAVRGAVELAGVRSRRQARTTDADQLASITRTPAGLWVGIFVIGTAAGLAVGARWLLSAL